MFRLVVLVSLVAAGCYAPEFETCRVRCAQNAEPSCPEGQFCLADNFCHASEGEDACPCLPKTCDEVPGTCGEISDGCNGTLQCAGCPSGQSCSAQTHTCVDPPECEPAACPINVCGPFDNGCETTTCNTCNAPTVCGGTGVAHACGTCSVAKFMPGFPAMNCGTANPWYCSNINACLADEVNCLTRTTCPNESGEFFCPCGFVVSCATKDCVPATD
ncbi:MAG TPA: hypothetical protein VFQ53_19915 [Kofleriaceae bacterium]|nr:hypothetical protein [Kofleriaceae bacterium]